MGIKRNIEENFPTMENFIFIFEIFQHNFMEILNPMEILKKHFQMTFFGRNV